jgi:hypothetical protein
MRGSLTGDCSAEWGKAISAVLKKELWDPIAQSSRPSAGAEPIDQAGADANPAHSSNSDDDTLSLNSLELKDEVSSKKEPTLGDGWHSPSEPHSGPAGQEWAWLRGGSSSIASLFRERQERRKDELGLPRPSS